MLRCVHSGEIQARYRRDTGEIQARYRRDTNLQGVELGELAHGPLDGQGGGRLEQVGADLGGRHGIVERLGVSSRW